MPADPAMTKRHRAWRPVFAAIALLAASLPLQAQELPLPALTGRVVDRAEMLSQQAEETIAARLEIHEQATGNQIVVVTLPDLMGRPIVEWGLTLGRGWAIGQAERNNGIVFLIAPNERELRIEVGYGLEGELPDAMAGRIIRNDIVPHFKAGNMEAGVLSGVDAIVAALDNSYEPGGSTTEANDAPHTLLDRYGPYIFPGLWLIAAIAMWRKRRRNKERNAHQWYHNMGNDRSRSSSGSRSGGGFSGRGGSFGGGGASGRW